MIDREKQKIKKAREPAGEVIEATPKGKGKHRADGEAETDSPAGGAKKKAKGRKKAAEQEEAKEDDGADGEEGVVKAESEGMSPTR
jgi:hypothetical protein